jgi:tRNA modification GTPase
VDAETTAQARQALDQLEGGLARRYSGWREALVAALALLEAAVDFPEEDAGSQAGLSARPGLQNLLGELECALAESGRGRLVRDGYRIALIGAPNAGKSSLINMLAAREVAIVNAAPGTTRDVIEAVMTVVGYRVLLSDTAGLRASDDAVEAEGARRAAVAAETAALRLWVVDGSSDTEAWRAAAPLVRSGDICLLNKADLGEGEDGANARAVARQHGLDVVALSAKTGAVAPLLAVLEDRVRRDLSGADFPAATRARHAELLRTSADHVTRSLQRFGEPELAAEDVRLAARAMERITGAVGAEDVLDRVFSTFCIGK